MSHAVTSPALAAPRVPDVAFSTLLATRRSERLGHPAPPPATLLREMPRESQGMVTGEVERPGSRCAPEPRRHVEPTLSRARFLAAAAAAEAALARRRA